MKKPVYVIGVDIGGTRVKYGIVEIRTGVQVASLVRPTDFRTLSQFIQAFKSAVRALVEEAGLGESDLKAIGMGVPGFVEGDFISQVWEHLSFLKGEGFQKSISEAMNKPVRLDNDARAVALGELHYGKHGRADRMLSLTLGTGVGFAFIVDGELQEKSSIRHLGGHILIRPGAAACYCGLSGCLESLVNGPRLVESFQAYQEGSSREYRFPETAEGVFCGAREGHAEAVKAVEKLVEDLTAGLNVYINVFAPDLIVLGGGLSKGIELYLPEIEEALIDSPFEGYQVRVDTSHLVEDAGLLGAAALCKNVTDEG